MAEYQKAVQIGSDKAGNPIMQLQTHRFKSKDSQSRKGMKGKAAGGRQSRYGGGGLLQGVMGQGRDAFNNIRNIWGG